MNILSPRLFRSMHFSRNWHLAFALTLLALSFAGRSYATSYVDTYGNATVYLDDDHGWLGWYSLSDPYSTLEDLNSDSNFWTAVEDLVDYYWDNVYCHYYANVDAVTGAYDYEIYADNWYVGNDASGGIDFWMEPYYDGNASTISAWAYLEDPTGSWSVSNADEIGDTGSTTVYATSSGSVAINVSLSYTEGVDVSWNGAGSGSGLTRTISGSANSQNSVELVINGTSWGTFRVLMFAAAPGGSATQHMNIQRDTGMSVPGFGASTVGNASTTVAPYYDGGSIKFTLSEVNYDGKWNMVNGGRTEITGDSTPFPLGMGMSSGSYPSNDSRRTVARADLTPNGSNVAPLAYYVVMSAIEAHEVDGHLKGFRDTSDASGALTNAESDIASSAHWVSVTTSSSGSLATDALSAKQGTFDSAANTRFVYSWNHGTGNSEANALAIEAPLEVSVKNTINDSQGN